MKLIQARTEHLFLQSCQPIKSVKGYLAAILSRAKNKKTCIVNLNQVSINYQMLNHLKDPK